MKRNISKKDFYRLLLWFAGDQSRLLGWIRSNASCGSVTVVRLPWLKRGCRQDLNSTFISLVRSDSEHSHRSCSIPGWIPIPHIKRCFYRFWYDPSGSNPLSVFYKKLLVGRDGIYSLFESYSENPKPFWWSPFGFLLWRKVSFESFTFDLRFFPIHRSKKYRTNCSSDPFWILRSSLAFGIQEIILLWKSDFGIQRQVPSCQIWPGSSITMMVLLSFLSSLRLFLLSLTGCLEFLDLGFVLDRKSVV